MNEINLKLETKVIESKSITVSWKWVMGEPEFEMSHIAYAWFVSRDKTINLIKRLKTLN